MALVKAASLRSVKNSLIQKLLEKIKPGIFSPGYGLFFVLLLVIIKWKRALPDPAYSGQYSLHFLLCCSTASCWFTLWEKVSLFYYNVADLSITLKKE